jgi:hypothetical protein
MKKLLASIAIIFLSLVSFAQGYTHVSGYTRSNGTYVQGYYRTLPNDTRNDNWSTIGNTNPFTGVAGTKPGDSYYSSSYSSYSTPAYSSYSYSTPTYSTYSSPSYNCSCYYITPTYYSTYSIPSYSPSSYYSGTIYSSSISVSTYSNSSYNNY